MSRVCKISPVGDLPVLVMVKTEHIQQITQDYLFETALESVVFG